MSDPYEVLGVTKNAPDAVVEAAYRALVKQHHPDHGGSSEKFHKIKEAYETIESDRTREANGESLGAFSNFGGMPVSESEGVGSLDEGLSVNGKYLTVAVETLTKIDISGGIVYASGSGADTFDKLDAFKSFDDSGPYRYLVVFDVENTSDRLIAWETGDTKFHGTDGYTYTSSNHALNEHLLSARLNLNYAEIEAGRKAKVVTLVESMPEGVEVEEIVHTLDVFEKGKVSGWAEEEERYVFNIQPKNESALRELPPGLSSLK